MSGPTRPTAFTSGIPVGRAGRVPASTRPLLPPRSQHPPPRSNFLHTPQCNRLAALWDGIATGWRKRASRCSLQKDQQTMPLAARAAIIYRRPARAVPAHMRPARPASVTAHALTMMTVATVRYRHQRLWVRLHQCNNLQLLSNPDYDAECRVGPTETAAPSTVVPNITSTSCVKLSCIHVAHAPCQWCVRSQRFPFVTGCRYAIAPLLAPLVPITPTSCASLIQKCPATKHVKIMPTAVPVGSVG